MKTRDFIIYFKLFWKMSFSKVDFIVKGTSYYAIIGMKWHKIYYINKKFTNFLLESFIDVLFVEEVNLKDNHTCSYKGCEGGDFFFEIFKLKKSRSPPN